MLDIFQELIDSAEKADLRFLLVGGHAVNAYGYTRTTYDIDLLISEEQFEKWKLLLKKYNYTCFHKTSAFAQFKFSSEEVGFPIDLMTVDSDTFEKLWKQKQIRHTGNAQLPLPYPLHLIALKLHALHTPDRMTERKDLYDIVELIKHCEIDIESIEFKELTERYGTNKMVEEIRAELNKRTNG